jgi:hypothetical protein
MNARKRIKIFVKKKENQLQNKISITEIYHTEKSNLEKKYI